VTDDAVTADQFARDAAIFRAARIARLTSATGWLTLVARYPLDRGPNALPIGTATLDDNGRVTLSVAPGVTVTSDGAPVGDKVLRSDAEPGGPDRVLHGQLSYELIRRGDNFALRVRDPESAHRRDFPGTEWFPARREWAVAGHFEPFPEERLISIPYDIGPVLSRSPGQVALPVAGRTFRLDCLMDDDRKRLFILFGDETNRDLTYPAGRFVYSPLPDPATGRVVVDFNCALNPACAFTEFASCPFPPPQNRLPLRVEAGEKRYQAH
jgi:uncharacterized protein (DUF1684 family)